MTIENAMVMVQMHWWKSLVNMFANWGWYGQDGITQNCEKDERYRKMKMKKRWEKKDFFNM